MGLELAAGQGVSFVAARLLGGKQPYLDIPTEVMPKSHILRPSRATLDAADDDDAPSDGLSTACMDRVVALSSIIKGWIAISWDVVDNQLMLNHFILLLLEVSYCFSTCFLKFLIF